MAASKEFLDPAKRQLSYACPGDRLGNVSEKQSQNAFNPIASGASSAAAARRREWVGQGTIAQPAINRSAVASLVLDLMRELEHRDLCRLDDQPVMVIDRPEELLLIRRKTMRPVR